MKLKSVLKSGLVVAGILLAASCSRHHNGMGYDDDVSVNGLGQFTHFAGQEPGESYTTRAPHSQRYLFSYDESNVASKYIASIEAQAGYLRDHPGARVLLAGHTDERGSREYNIALGERRASTVADIMRSAGASHRQIRIVSYGKERPANFGHDEGSHMQNRRVELTYEATR